MRKRCGYVAIVGRPNVGKSTLLNHLLGQKISITSRKPQTTRHNILGIKTTEDTQCIFVDTPGFHRGYKKAINRQMNRAVINAVNGVDAIIFLVEKSQWLAEDQLVADQLKTVKSPIILAINKIDQMADKHILLPHMQQLMADVKPQEIIPISALQHQNLEQLITLVSAYFPESEPFFSSDQLTDRSSRFLAAEIIREKITRRLGDELPYQVTVEIESFTHQKDVMHIHALIIVEREGQRRILIGNKGSKLKQIGQQARQDMESLFCSQVMLKTWVKVQSGWSDSERALRSLGYHD